MGSETLRIILLRPPASTAASTDRSSSRIKVFSAAAAAASTDQRNYDRVDISIRRVRSARCDGLQESLEPRRGGGATRARRARRTTRS